jgi:beta-N-acetylhexosaminidase
MTTAPESRIVLGFEGPEPPDWLVAAHPEKRPGGFILGVHWNVEDAEQVRRLTTSLQALAEPGLPFLICADEEGGQLAACTGITTPFPGAMALGATGDTDLARRVAGASGEELAALGVNVVLAPVVDVVTRPDNPSLGIRGFGDDPNVVARLGAAMVSGYQEAGVAATAKHFPGKGEAVVDPHETLPVLDLDDDRLDAVEFAPFRAAADAGVDLLMIGHYSVPVLTGDRVTPISASPALRDVVRRRVGFGGVVISDALDMGAFTASGTNAALVAAGVDALLCMTDRERAAAATLAIAGSDPNDHTASTGRLTALRRRLASRREPGLDRLRSPEHLAIAAEVAVRSLTLVRDGGTLPLLRGERILAVMPRPTDLTPADTSSFQVAGLAGALRGQAGSVSEVVVPIEPESTDIDAVLAAAGEHDAVVLGTIAADVHPGQAALARRLIAAVPRVITVAMRTPFDLAAYPEATTHVCTYSLLEPSMTALAGALFGFGSFPGRLPAPIPGLYPTGHGLTGSRAAP